MAGKKKTEAANDKIRRPAAPDDGAFRKQCQELVKDIRAAEKVHKAAKEKELKTKHEVEALYDELASLCEAEQEKNPLFDRSGTGTPTAPSTNGEKPPAPVEGCPDVPADVYAVEDKSWMAEKIEDALALPVSLLAKLKSAEIEFAGDLAAYMKEDAKLANMKGIGVSKASSILAAWNEFWRKRKEPAESVS